MNPHVRNLYNMHVADLIEFDPLKPGYEECTMEGSATYQVVNAYGA